ncbi:AAA family ATPase [Anatilimnocola sp. NA78]|uniref:AAA family ATPase n=1 Tax=Anatilimnocola sp. NA78 TaxID=3415683 RepID=UPI003CE55B00
MVISMSDQVPVPTTADSDDQFFAAIASSNPFERNRISDPTDMDSDVESIHAAAFDRLTSLADETLRAEAGNGAMLLGNAGVGKSHLLARFWRWAKDRQACFVFLHNIQVRPSDMSRYLLKCCISRLAEDRLDRLRTTPLFELLKESVRKTSTDLFVKHKDDLRKASAAIAERLQLDPQIFFMLFRFFFSVQIAVNSSDPAKRDTHNQLAALAVRWLKGELLDAEEAKSLGIRLRPSEEVTELGEDQIVTVLATIARLSAVIDRPFVLCIDQADNMQEDQLTALSRALQNFIDRRVNLLVVVSGVHDEMLRLIDQGVIPAAAADRFQHRQPIVVRRIGRSEAKQLVSERLQSFFARFDGLPAQCKPFFNDDDLFPLGREWFENMEAGAIELRPRDVLTWASDRWRTIQGQIRTESAAAWLRRWNQAAPETSPQELTAEELQRAIDAKVAAKFEEAITSRRLQPGSLPADSDNLLRLVAQSLKHCEGDAFGYTLEKVDVTNHPVHLLVQEGVGERKIRNHVQFVVTGSKTSAAASLRRLLDHGQPDLRVLVTDEERAPLCLGAAGKQHLQQLVQRGERGFRHVKLRFEDYAALDAMLNVVGEAKSGDLEIEPLPRRIMPLTEVQVLESFHRQDAFRKHVLLRQFLTEEGPAAPPATVYPPKEGFREFVQSRLAFLMGANMIELIKQFIAANPAGAVTPEACLPTAKEIVLEMHQEELVSAQPWDNDLYLTIGIRA